MVIIKWFYNDDFYDMLILLLTCRLWNIPCCLLTRSVPCLSLSAQARTVFHILLYWFHLVRPSICGQNCVRSVSFTWQYWPDPFHIYTPYLATLEGVSWVKIYSKFEILANSLNLYLWLCLDLTWDPIWINSMLIIGQRGVSSDRRPSSCSSFN